MRRLTLGLLAVSLLSATPSAAAAAPTAPVAAARGGVPAVVPFAVTRTGEALVRFTVWAPGVDWSRAGAESAVAEVSVDGRYAGDLVVPSSTPTARALALGPLRRGVHVLVVRLSRAKSSPAARAVFLRDVRVAVPAAQAVLAHAPIVIGRSLPELGTPAQNATTDTPLLAWHEVRPAATAGHVIVEYSVVWSNEDGGTDTPALMARWGRTTDIEWIYRVELDATGARVPGSDVFQAPNHATLSFTGRYEGNHPILQTCTANNNMCDAVDPAASMRFFLAADQTRDPARSRESLMDANPWTYQVMAAEMLREGKVSPSDPATPAMGDQRTYLFLEIKKTTGAGTTPGTAPGVAVGVRLRNSPTIYRSDHSQLSWAIARDDPAATTIELPAGTTAADIAEITAIRTPMDLTDNGAPVTVTSINRAFFLGADYLPGHSFIATSLNLTLTTANPAATAWTS